MSDFTAGFYGFIMDNPSSVWYEIFNIGFIVWGFFVSVSLYFFYFVLNGKSARYNSKKAYFLNSCIFLFLLIIIESMLAFSIGEFVGFDGEVLRFLLTNAVYFMIFYVIISLFVKKYSTNGSNVPTSFKFF